MIADRQLGNRDAAPLLRAVAARQPDLFLAMEIGDWWKPPAAPESNDEAAADEAFAGAGVAPTPR